MLLYMLCKSDHPRPGSMASSDEGAADQAEADLVWLRVVFVRQSPAEVASIMEVKKPWCAVKGARGM